MAGGIPFVGFINGPIANYSQIIADAANTQGGASNPAFAPDDLWGIFPDLVGQATPAFVTMQIARATAGINSNRFGDDWQYAMALYVAHEITIASNLAANGGGATGLVTSESVGGVSASYDYGNFGGAEFGTLGQTGYGQQLITLVNRAGIGAMYLQ